MAKGKGPSQAKACKIAKHGEVRGKPLSRAQKGFMGARCGGKPLSKKR